jgi:hypothetical protein
MNIIELARKVWCAGDVYIGPQEDQLERFAHLVRAAALEDAERVCEEVSFNAANHWILHYNPLDQGREHGADECAIGIQKLKANSL